jgi:hypothetical protein
MIHSHTPKKWKINGKINRDKFRFWTFKSSEAELWVVFNLRQKETQKFRKFSSELLRVQVWFKGHWHIFCNFFFVTGNVCLDVFVPMGISCGPLVLALGLVQATYSRPVGHWQLAYTSFQKLWQPCAQSSSKKLCMVRSRNAFSPKCVFLCPYIKKQHQIYIVCRHIYFASCLFLFI